jgi:hypothetical protein
MLKTLSLAIAAAALLGTMAVGPSYATHGSGDLVCHYDASDGIGRVIRADGCPNSGSCVAHLENHDPNDHPRENNDYECSGSTHNVGDICQRNPNADGEAPFISNPCP